MLLQDHVMPIHDHPHQTVISKIFKGTIHCKQFARSDDAIILDDNRKLYPGTAVLDRIYSGSSEDSLVYFEKDNPLNYHT